MSLTTFWKRRNSRQGPGPPEEEPSRLGALDVLGWSIWLGLSAGLLEVGARVLCRAIDPRNRLYLMSRHFVWLVPLVNMLLFFGLGLVLAGIMKLWPRSGGRLSPRLLCALAMQPMLMVAVPAIYPAAWFVLALGISSQLVPWLESQPARWRFSLLVRTLPFLLGTVLLLLGAVLGEDWLNQRRETTRALPPAGSPNVLFVVLDTVRRDHLSLHGYRRPTTPNLERLARDGIRFDRAHGRPVDSPFARQFLHGLLAP